jgi:Protein of unknown function (DUF3089)
VVAINFPLNGLGLHCNPAARKPEAQIMARKFLYIIAIIIVMILTGAFALRMFPTEFARIAFVPTTEFKAEPETIANAYAKPTMWIARPAAGGTSIAEWTPSNYATLAPEEAAVPAKSAAVFFIHPTSFLDRRSWNAPLDDKTANDRSALFVKAMASPFAAAGQVWAPRYRQAAIGAFLAEDTATAGKAFDLAYDDVMTAFDQFLIDAGPNRRIILAGHSQGAMHLGRLLKERVAGDAKLKRRIVAVYAVGWPISIDHDLPSLGLPPCTAADENGCILSWQSYAEPAEPQMVLDAYAKSIGLDGQARGKSRMLCVNPLTGTQDGVADAARNPGTLRPNETLDNAELVAKAVPARCDPAPDGPGLLLIGDPPQVGPYVLPGQNYHVYDIPLFWQAVREDALRRLAKVSAR